jgi:hypothetical protein
VAESARHAFWLPLAEAQFAFSKKQENKKLSNTGLAFMYCGEKITVPALKSMIQ